jgi:hypothetical protein
MLGTALYCFMETPLIIGGKVQPVGRITDITDYGRKVLENIRKSNGNGPQDGVSEYDQGFADGFGMAQRQPRTCPHCNKETNPE